MKHFISKFLLIFLLFNTFSYSSSDFCNEIISELEKDITSYRDRPYYDQTISYGFHTKFENLESNSENYSYLIEGMDEKEYLMKIDSITGTNYFTDYIKNESGDRIKIIKDFVDINSLINQNPLIKSDNNFINHQGTITKEQFNKVDNYIMKGDYIITINGLKIENQTIGDRIKIFIKNHPEILKENEDLINSKYDGDSYEFVRRKVVVGLPEVFKNDLIDQLNQRKRISDISNEIISGFNGYEYNREIARDYVGADESGRKRDEIDYRSEQFYNMFPINDLKLRLGIYRPSNFSKDHVPNIEEDLFFVDIYPDYKNDVTEVNLDYKIGDIRDINVQNNIFIADYSLSKNWKDYDLGALASKIISKNDNNTNQFGSILGVDNLECIFFSNDKNFEVINKIWQPEYRKLNQLSVEKNKFKETYKIKFYLKTKYNSPGNFASITLDEIGTSQFTINFNYAAFPFDIQKIIIGLEQSNPKVLTNFRNKDEKVNFFSASSKNIDLSESLNQFAHKLSGWSIFSNAVYDTSFEPITIRNELASNFGVEEKNGELFFLENDFTYFFLKEEFIDDYSSVFQYSQEIQRNWKYFLFKIIAPIVLILIVCWSIFWTPSRELESRLTVTITCFLALVAYTFVIDDDLPKLAYLTLMDYIILVSYFFAAMPTILSIISHRIHKQSEIGSMRLDNYSKFIGPLTYLIFIYIIIFGTVSPENSIQALKSITFK